MDGFDILSCSAEGCHMEFAFRSGTVKRLRETHETFHCPFGHRQHFPQQTEEEKLRKTIIGLRGYIDEKDAEIKRLKNKPKATRKKSKKKTK